MHVVERLSAAQLLLRSPPSTTSTDASTRNPGIDSSSCFGTYRDSVSHSTPIASQTLASPLPSTLASFLSVAVSRCNWRGQPPIATLKLVGMAEPHTKTKSPRKGGFLQVAVSEAPFPRSFNCRRLRDGRFRYSPTT